MKKSINSMILSLFKVTTCDSVKPTRFQLINIHLTLFYYLSC